MGLSGQDLACRRHSLINRDRQDMQGWGWDLGLECCTNAMTEKADMAVSAEIKGRAAVDGGLYYLDEVARILAVTDLEVRGSGSGLGVRRLGGLQRRGFFLLGINELRRASPIHVVWCGGDISCCVVASFIRSLDGSYRDGA